MRRDRVASRFDPMKDSRGQAADESRTKQSFVKECDINVLMGRYLKTGQINHLAKHGGHYGDFSPMNFQDAMNVVRQTEEMFEDLDSSIRKRFHNNPAEFLEFVQDARNQDECIKLGLAVKKEVPKAPEPLLVRVAGESPPLGGSGGGSPPTRA